MTIQTMEETQKEIAPRPKHEVAGAEATRPGRYFTPPVDIFETEDAITVLADMPGVKADALTVDLREGILTIEGRVAEALGSKERVLLREYETGAFRREFRLTELIDQARIEATLKEGVLRLTLPKAEAARPRRIAVQAG